MPEKQPKDVEHVVAIIGQSERVDDGVVMDDCGHGRHDRHGDDESWEPATAVLGVPA